MTNPTITELATRVEREASNWTGDAKKILLHVAACLRALSQKGDE